MIALTTALIEYWHRLPTSPVAARRQSLETARRRVRARELAPCSLLPFALADYDDDVVFTATQEFVVSGRHAEGVASGADDALEWIRRHLALNRGAVFAALLSLGDGAVNDRLAGLRLTLSANEVATVCRRAAPARCEHTRRFLAHWLELLSCGSLPREGEIIAAALGADSPPLAA